MVDTVYLHLLVDGASHDVTRSKREALVILLHERFAVRQTQYAAVTAHSLRDKEGGMGLAGMIKRCRMELHELHVLHRSLSTINHSLAVARCDNRISGCLVYSATTACTHQRHLTQVSVHLLRLRIEHVSSIAVNMWGAARYASSEMVLCDNLHSEVVFLNVDVRTSTHGSHQAALNLSSRVVGMVKDAKLRVSALTMKVELAVFLTVEIHTPLHQFFYLCRSITHHQFHSITV